MQHTIFKILQEGGIENAISEARWIVKYGGRSGYGEGYGYSSLRNIAHRRVNGEPLQYLIGEWEFYGYPFNVGPGVLIPRPETELLVDLAKEHCAADSLVLDLCSGTGCVGISVAREVKCRVIAVENSPKAVVYLKENVGLNKVKGKVRVLLGDALNVCSISTFLKTGVSSPVILINAPYLSSREMSKLQKEVTFEPVEALYGGGEDGLDFYRRFFAEWSFTRQYNKNLLACEVGEGQAEAVCEMIERIGGEPQIMKDSGGISRIVYSVKFK
jgi:release factor glutamine methyltransferase